MDWVHIPGLSLNSLWLYMRNYSAALLDGVRQLSCLESWQLPGRRPRTVIARCRKISLSFPAIPQPTSLPWSIAFARLRQHHNLRHKKTKSLNFFTCDLHGYRNVDQRLTQSLFSMASVLYHDVFMAGTTRIMVASDASPQPRSSPAKYCSARYRSNPLVVVGVYLSHLSRP